MIASRFLDLTAASLHSDPALSSFTGPVSKSGKGGWTAGAAVEEGVPPMCSPLPPSTPTRPFQASPTGSSPP